MAGTRFARCSTPSPCSRRGARARWQRAAPHRACSSSAPAGRTRWWRQPCTRRGWACLRPTSRGSLPTSPTWTTRSTCSLRSRSRWEAESRRGARAPRARSRSPPRSSACYQSWRAERSSSRSEPTPRRVCSGRLARCSSSPSRSQAGRWPTRVASTSPSAPPARSPASSSASLSPAASACPPSARASSSSSECRSTTSLLRRSAPCASTPPRRSPRCRSRWGIL
mmetsp:Transcript_46483/g.154090  ORF Transcript_46483/g.154090 Transcript_46483/m.154090 type:complete len:225 (-) Transcript_46483:647-1321(-)